LVHILFAATPSLCLSSMYLNPLDTSAVLVMVCIQSSLFHPCSKGERICLKLTLLTLLNSVSGITTRRHVRSRVGSLYYSLLYRTELGTAHDHSCRGETRLPLTFIIILPFKAQWILHDPHDVTLKASALHRQSVFIVSYLYE
jgi:hypothetical protein